MWFAYMDETGNTGRNLTDPNQPIHLILTLAVDESNVMTIHDHVRDVASRHCPQDCSRDDFEFHGHAIFAGSGFFAGMTPATRIQITTSFSKASPRRELTWSFEASTSLGLLGATAVRSVPPGNGPFPPRG
jgi:hypothetical protein